MFRPAVIRQGWRLPTPTPEGQCLLAGHHFCLELYVRMTMGSWEAAWVRAYLCSCPTNIWEMLLALKALSYRYLGRF